MLRLASLLAVASAVAAQCKFGNGEIQISYSVKGNTVHFDYENNNIGNDEWAGIGFGPDMSDLDVIMFRIEGSKVSHVTGHTSGYGPPDVDNDATIVPSGLKFNSNKLKATFSRPLGAVGPRGHSLEKCQMWHLTPTSKLVNGRPTMHPTRPISHRVCPNECVTDATSRDTLTNPVPPAALYNNRQSSRFDEMADAASARAGKGH